MEVAEPGVLTLRILVILGGILILVNMFRGAFHWITAGGDRDAIDEARTKMQAAVNYLLALIATLALAWVLDIQLGFTLTSDLIVFLVLPIFLIGVMLNSLLFLEDNLRKRLQQYLKLRQTKSPSKESLTIVGIMVNHRAKKLFYSLLMSVLGLVLYGAIVLLFSLDFNVWIAGVIIVYAVVLLLNEYLLVYRIKKGYYGESENDTREMLRFIIDHADKIDFNDRGGTRKLMPAPELEPEQGRSVTGGATI